MQHYPMLPMFLPNAANLSMVIIYVTKVCVQVLNRKVALLFDSQHVRAPGPLLSAKPLT